MRPGQHSGIRRVVWAQAALLLPAGLVGFLAKDVLAGVAAAYGVLVALAVSLVLWRRERQALRHPEWDQHRLFKLFVVTSVERLVVLVALLAVGFTAWQLPPLPQLLGLLVAQLAWLAVATR